MLLHLMTDIIVKTTLSSIINNQLIRHLDSCSSAANNLAKTSDYNNISILSAVD